MNLNPHGREFYGFTPTFDPPVEGSIEASFDDPDVWIPGEADPDTPGGYRWLLAGHLAPMGAAVARIDHSMTPDVRAVDSPEIPARKADVPPIRYKKA